MFSWLCPCVQWLPSPVSRSGSGVPQMMLTWIIFLSIFSLLRNCSNRVVQMVDCVTKGYILIGWNLLSTDLIAFEFSVNFICSVDAHIWN